jgi:hypothetical protein
MSLKTPLCEVPVPSTGFTTEAYYDGQAEAIRFSYEKEGAPFQSGIKFSRVAAYRERAERCCTAWHIEEAYDTLVEVEGSPWVDEIREDTQELWRDTWAMHHYMIYLDSTGCLEVIAESWTTI